MEQTNKLILEVFLLKFFKSFLPIL